MQCTIRLLLVSLLLCHVANARADLVAAPGQLVFPLAVVGETSEPLFVTLANTGAATLTVVGLTPADGAYARAGGSCGTVPFPLAAQASCTLGYTFTPFFQGVSSQTLRATPDIGAFVDFGLLGQAQVGALRTDPGQLMFPVQAVGATVGPLFVTLNNISNAPVTVASLTPASGEYARAGGSCGEAPFTLAARAGCTLGYTFSPGTVGAFYQTLRATPTAGEHVDFGLAGEGDRGRLGVEPGDIYFLPAVGVGGISEERFVTLENSGRVPLEVLAIGPFVAPPVESFFRTGGSCATPPFTILAYSSCTLAYTFAPVEIGEVILELQLENSGGSAETLTLRGEGLLVDVVFADGFEEI
ncbi:MAG: choice-of-anchor D domain-containing protein [Xanthomonadales bacterium]|nr:choice-of-anchor D domain-containing protein [Xanthomonadales bacterium]